MEEIVHQEYVPESQTVDQHKYWGSEATENDRLSQEAK
jgi:hypothetical protein